MESKFNTNIAEPFPRKKNDHEDGDLPEWLLLEILIRLPIKSIFKFKTISNWWNSLISDPSFIKSYLSHRKTSSSLPWTLLTRFTPWDVSDKIFQYHKLGRLCCDDYKSPDFSVPDLPDPRLQNKPYQGATIASSNGLLLCRESDPYIYRHYVCNPVTKQWVTLPPYYSYNGKRTIHYMDGFITQVDQGGIIITSYMVVLPPQCHVATTTRVLNMDIFASETGNWRCIQVNCPESIRIPWSDQPILFNGILHWLTGFEIVAYDPYHDLEGCRIIKNPSRNTSHSTNIPRKMGVCQGHLLYVMMLSDRLEVWVLRDYDSGKWHLEHCIGYDDISGNWHLEHCIEDYDIGLGRGLGSRLQYDQYIIPLAVHPFDSTLVYFSYKEQILCYNMRSKELKLLHNRQSCLRWQVPEQGSVVTFVLPPWPSPVPLMRSHHLS